ncbi:MAG: permease, partial [Deltaproteobacteria bacterium]|nr:permease [Deltaproteobacteria bacterium]
MKERTKLLLIILIFIGCYYIPWGNPTIRQSGLEAFMMLQEYARKHVLTCLIPAFFIAGAIAVFVSQASVLKYFGATAKKILSYSVASVSGTVLAVCSCTVLPLFAGIYTRGAGIGPATAFLYSGPAINVLAIVLTARILGWQLGLARAIGAVIFAVLTGLLMAFIFRKDDAARAKGEIFLPEDEGKGRTLTQDALFMFTMVLILIFAAFA